jgi:hypothetical protein
MRLRRTLIFVTSVPRTGVIFRKMMSPGTTRVISVPEFDELPSVRLPPMRAAPACPVIRSVRPFPYLRYRGQYLCHCRSHAAQGRRRRHERHLAALREYIVIRACVHHFVTRASQHKHWLKRILCALHRINTARDACARLPKRRRPPVSAYKWP